MKLAIEIRMEMVCNPSPFQKVGYRMTAGLQIFPTFHRVETLRHDVTSFNFSPDSAYLLDENRSLADFISRVGKEYEEQNKPINLYDFYIAYNLKFPTTPSTVSLIDDNKIIGMGISDFSDLLNQLIMNQKRNARYAVFLSTSERTPEEMMRFKRNIFQQFIYLRMYLPIIIADSFREAKKNLSEIVNADGSEHTSVTFVGTKKAGKSSLINAILGAEYSPSSSELPTPNKIMYAWSGGKEKRLHVQYDGNSKNFDTSSELRDYLRDEFRKANHQQSMALKPMQVYIPGFPSNLRNFSIIDTPGPNLAASKNKAHEKITMEAMKEMQHAVFVMNYSSYLTDDEIKLFDRIYKFFNNKHCHQTIIVAVNRIDEMYGSDVIKSYERFADYVRVRLNKLGYDNIVVVGVSAITAVYTEKVRELMPQDIYDFRKCLEKLNRRYKGTDHATEVSFVNKAVRNIEDFHDLIINSLSELMATSRVDYLQHVIAATYHPSENFGWNDESLDDIFEKDFANDAESVDRVRHLAKEGDLDAMNVLGVLYLQGDGVEKDAKKAFEWFSRAAKAEDITGMENVAYCYRHGEGVQQNTNRALEWYNNAIDAGSTWAMCQLAEMYHYGDKIEEDQNKAFLLYRRAAYADDVDAMVPLSSMYYNGEGTVQDLKKAYKWALAAAKKEDLPGMECVAYLYRSGKGVQQDINRALEWYNNAIDAGSTQAMCELAEMYWSGEFIEQDSRKAFLLYRQAAEAGDIYAMNRLGDMYIDGEGTAQDISQAVKWYRKAAAKEYGMAMFNLGYCYQYGYGVTGNFNDASIWYERAANAGVDDALKQLGNMYRKKKQYRTALEWYRKGVKKGDADCMNYLGEMYHNGEGVTSNYNVALNWYRKAAEAGSMLAINNLGDAYYNAYGVARNYQKAFEFYQQAANEGDIASSMISLGNMYRYGEGVTKNYNKAMFWYKKARKNGDNSAQECILISRLFKHTNLEMPCHI